MTIFGWDWGKNLGIAVADSEIGDADALEVVNLHDRISAVRQLQKLWGRWQPKLVVVGLPLSPEEEETGRSRQIRRESRQLLLEIVGDTTKLPPLEFVSERYSTQAGTRGLSPSQKRDKGDAYAAAHILESYREHNRG